MKRAIYLICLTMYLTSCSQLSVYLTPIEVQQSIAQGFSVANSAVENPPETEEDRQAYFKANAELWKELAIWFELIPQEE